MSAWIECDIAVSGVEGSTVDFLHQWAEKNCPAATKIVGRGEKRSKIIPPHMTALFHGHPASPEFLEALKEFSLKTIEMITGGVKGVKLVPVTNMLILEIESRDMCELFERLYASAVKATGYTPTHKLLEGYYKHYSPHITLAHYANREDAERDLSALSAPFAACRTVFIDGFLLYEWKKETGAVKVDFE